MDGLQVLLGKLEKAKFTGKLEIRYENGSIAAAELRHHLPYSELGRALPTVEPEQFELKP